MRTHNEPSAALSARTRRLIELDHAHVWHPFTAMKQWREHTPLVIERGEGPYLFDTEGNRYIDGVSSLWCNVHGHRVAEIDRAVREQLDRVAHSTLLGLGSPPSIELAARLAALAPGDLNKVFYSDAGATAVEVAFKLAVGYWFHRGRPEKRQFIGIGGAYHGDTVGAMSVGYSDLFHRPFASMVFPTAWMASPDPCRPPEKLHSAIARASQRCDRCRGENACGIDYWPSECPVLAEMLKEHCLAELDALLTKQADQTAAIVIEPIMQGAAGMICQPEGFVRGVAELARKHGVLLVADEVAVGFGRTGKMFAVEREGVTPDLLCLAKGISAGYLPLAATIATDELEDAFCGELSERKTFFHGHTYTGNALACAAALASLDLFERDGLLERINKHARLISTKLDALHASEHVLDVRQRGMMVGIELTRDRATREPFDFAARVGHQLCDSLRPHGVIVRPLGNVVILMPIPAMPTEVLEEMLDKVVDAILHFSFPA